MRHSYWTALTLSLLAACANEISAPTGAGPDAGGDPDPAPDSEPEPEPELGMIFALGNQDGPNDVVAFVREVDGSLEKLGAFPTGGVGTGAGLGSQAALVLSEDEQYLYAVNAGSDEISSFRIFPDHLALIDVAPSGGHMPVSLTTQGNRLYVVHGEGAGSVNGFAVEEGRLVPIAGASMALSTTESPTAPAQIQLSPDGRLLVVTEKATNRLVTYRVEDDGTLSEAHVTDSEGETPFGFAFNPGGDLIVSEAFGGAEGASAASSYETSGDGTLQVVSSSVPSGQAAACWIVVSSDGRYVYATNTASNTVSGYHIWEDASLTLFPDEGATASLPGGSGPIDMALADDDQFLYVLNAGADTIAGYALDEDGTLTPLDGDVAVPATAVGLAAY